MLSIFGRSIEHLIKTKPPKKPHQPLLRRYQPIKMPDGQAWLTSVLAKAANVDGILGGVNHDYDRQYGKIERISNSLEKDNFYEYKKPNKVSEHYCKYVNSLYEMMVSIWAHQYPLKYSHRLTEEDIEVLKMRQDFLRSTKIAYASPRVKEEGGVVQFASACGSYTRKDLLIYIDYISEMYAKTNLPVAAIVSSLEHSIVIGCNRLNELQVLDANHMATQYYSLTKKYAAVRAIYNSLLPHSPSLFCSLKKNPDVPSYVSAGTQFYSTSNNVDELKNVSNSLFQQSNWQKIHEITPNKAKGYNQHYNVLLLLAVKDNNFALVKQIIEAGADLYTNRKGHTPLSLAKDLGCRRLKRI